MTFSDTINKLETNISVLENRIAELEQENADLRLRISEFEKDCPLPNSDLLINDVFTKNCFELKSAPTNRQKIIEITRHSLEKGGYIRMQQLQDVSFADLLCLHRAGPFTVALIAAVCEHYGIYVKRTLSGKYPIRTVNHLNEMIEKVKTDIVYLT